MFPIETYLRTIFHFKSLDYCYYPHAGAQTHASRHAVEANEEHDGDKGDISYTYASIRKIYRNRYRLYKISTGMSESSKEQFRESLLKCVQNSIEKR